MKRVLLLTVIIVLVICLVGCMPIPKKQTNQMKGETGTIAEQEPAQTVTEEPTEPPAEDTAISPGYYLQKDTYKFTFERASLYDQIGDDEYFNDKPEEGKKFLVCFFEVENVSAEDSYVNSLYIKAYLDDYAINESVIFNEVDAYKSLGGDLQPGKKLKGYLCYEVNPDWKQLEFSYTDGVFDGQVYSFVVTPDDIS